MNQLQIEVNRQIGILRIPQPVPIIERTSHPILGDIDHHLLIVEGWAPLWFDYGELGAEVWTAADVVTVARSVRLPSKNAEAIQPIKFVFLRWSQHEVAASVMAKWAGHPHPIWDFQIDMAAARPEWEYDTVVTGVPGNGVESISFRRGVLLPPL